MKVAYVFLERPEEPDFHVFGPTELESARHRLAEVIERIGSSEFPTATPEDRGWSLCGGCPALGRMCSGPAAGPGP